MPLPFCFPLQLCCQLFLGLIGDLFPGLDCPRERYPSFNDAVEQALSEAGCQALEIQVDKVVQLYETLMTRHTTMIVGPTGGGKTIALGTLCRAQTIANLPTKQFIINPKAIPVSELYGMLDPTTRDWTDGLLSNIFRDMNRPVPEGRDERRYIVYDGDVDAVWVENMNSVMDDNKVRPPQLDDFSDSIPRSDPFVFQMSRSAAPDFAEWRAYPAQLSDMLDAL